MVNCEEASAGQFSNLIGVWQYCCYLTAIGFGDLILDTLFVIRMPSPC